MGGLCMSNSEIKNQESTVNVDYILIKKIKERLKNESITIAYLNTDRESKKQLVIKIEDQKLKLNELKKEIEKCKKEKEDLEKEKEELIKKIQEKEKIESEIQKEKEEIEKKKKEKIFLVG